MLRNRLCFLLALLAALPAAGNAQSPAPDALFAEGNARYQEGDFAAAEARYRALLEAGVDSGVLYYNLGNALFKQQKLGEAIFFWEKARRRLPSDPEIRENLELANLLVVDRIEAPEDPLPLRALRSAVHLGTILQEGRIALALFILANGLFTVWILAASPRAASWAFAAALVTLCLVLLVGCSIAWKVYEEHHRQEGVIVQSRVDIRSGPGEQYITVFAVHEGTLVRVRGEVEGWYQVSLPNGWNGWLPAGSLRII